MESRSLSPTASHVAPLADWERALTHAVGRAIEFWGFKANHGRVWALLYVRGLELDAGQLREVLGLSKGAVSMVTRELLGWGVIHSTRATGATSTRFRAETELKTMIGNVIEKREAKLVGEVEDALRAAERSAQAAQASTEAIEKLRRLTELAHNMRLALEAFRATSRLDVRSLASILVGEAGQRVRRLRQ